jgi:glutamate dehydrogenase (NADP+)
MNKLKSELRRLLADSGKVFPELSGCVHMPDMSVWDPCDIALPCATQNKILPKHVPVMVENGVHLVAEGANETIELYMKSSIF